MSLDAVPITLLYAGVMALLSVALANQVLWARINAKKLPDWKPDTTMRVQANFVENVPLALVVLYLLEVAGAPGLMVHALGALLVFARLAHTWGYSTNPGATYARLIGAQLTFLLVSVMGMGAIYLGIASRL